MEGRMLALSQSMSKSCPKFCSNAIALLLPFSSGQPSNDAVRLCKDVAHTQYLDALLLKVCLINAQSIYS
jgi:hypothetical protein